MSNQTAAKRGRPPKISRSRVVDTAIEIGLDRFSMDDVAARLGVTTPALYTHVAGRDEVVRLGAATVIGRTMVAPVDGDDWQTWLRAWSTRLRVELGFVGGELVDAIRDGLDVTQLEITERGIGLLLDAGLTPAEAGHTLWLAARIAVSTGPSGQSSVGRVAAATRSSAGDAAPVERPAMAAALDAVTGVDNDDAFAFDLDVLVAGVEARLVA
jgi:AcrR family transcriptional regulator